MSKYTSDKNYIYYENTNIPINKLNIRDLRRLEEQEQKLLLKGYEYFHRNLSEETIFDVEYFKELHRKTFTKLYDFAGNYRNINISKGYSTFCNAKFLGQTSEEIFKELAEDNFLKDYAEKPKEEFVKKITHYMCELIALHPFLELNGRIIRLFFDMISIYNGYDYIDYQNALKVQDEDNLFIQASIDCMTGNENLMYKIVFNGLNKVV